MTGNNKYQKTLIIFRTLAILILSFHSVISSAQTTLIQTQGDNGIIKLTNPSGTIVGYLKTDPLNSNWYLLYDQNGNFKIKLRKRSNGLQLQDDQISQGFLDASKSQKADTYNGNADKQQQDLFTKQADEIAQQNWERTKYFLEHPEALKRYQEHLREQQRLKEEKREERFQNRERRKEEIRQDKLYWKQQRQKRREERRNN